MRTTIDTVYVIVTFIIAFFLDFKLKINVKSVNQLTKEHNCKETHSQNEDHSHSPCTNKIGEFW